MYILYTIYLRGDFFSFFFSSFVRRSENFPVVRHTIFSTFRPRSPDKTRPDAIHLAGEKKSRYTRASHISSCHLPIMVRGKRISRPSPVKLNHFTARLLVNCRYIRPLCDMAQNKPALPITLESQRSGERIWTNTIIWVLRSEDENIISFQSFTRRYITDTDVLYNFIFVLLGFSYS